MTRRILVPARIDTAAIPLAFRGLQVADLSIWDGEDDAIVLQPLVRSVAALLAARREREPSTTTHAAAYFRAGAAAGPLRRVPPLEGVPIRMAVSSPPG